MGVCRGGGGVGNGGGVGGGGGGGDHFAACLPAYPFSWKLRQRYLILLSFFSTLRPPAHIILQISGNSTKTVTFRNQMGCSVIPAKLC